MKFKNKLTPVRLSAVALAGVCLLAGVALAAGEGTKEDPLITLSYLEQTATTRSSWWTSWMLLSRPMRLKWSRP